MPSTISAGTTAGTAIAIAGDTTGNLAFQTNGTTTAMTINTSQNVGIGVTNPAAATGFSTGRTVLQVSPSGGGSAQLRLGATSGTMIDHDDSGNTITTIRSLYGATSASAQMQLQSGFITFGTGTSFTERMRIDSSGDIFAGGSTINGATGSIYSKTNAKLFVQWQGASGTINQSKNVSSVTRNSTGDYTVNFSFSFSTNYAIVLGGSRNNGSTDAFSMNYYSQTGSSVRVNTSLPAITFTDAYTADLVVFA